MKVFWIVLDSVGIGAAPDAAEYGDAGAATLQHVAEAVGGLDLPVLQGLGLGNVPALLPDGLPIRGCPPVDRPRAFFGAMREVSEGKDTITGHWEMAGLRLMPGFRLFPDAFPAFPPELTAEFERRTGRRALGLKHAEGLGIIEELGEEASRTGAYVCYTSGDSVFQIAVDVDVVPLEELYRACEIARELCDPLRVGRVIARPFRRRKGGGFERTADRRDYPYPPPEPFVFEPLARSGVATIAVGKIADVFAGRGFRESLHAAGTAEAQEVVERVAKRTEERALIVANFIDFDMLYGHRRDPVGYAAALRQTDEWLGRFLPLLGPDDGLLLTADHGNDPTFRGSDHTREYVPLLLYLPGRSGRSLGVREGFFDVARTLAEWFGVPPAPRGQSFLPAEPPGER